MKRKTLNAFALTLATSLVLCSVNTGTSVLAAGKEENVIRFAGGEQETEELMEEMLQVKLENETGLVKDLIEDSILCKAVIDIYNQSTTEKVTEDNFTCEQFQDYSGKLDFSGLEDVDRIQSIKGLGNAKNAKMINLSALTGVTTIPEEEFAKCGFSSIILPSTIERILPKAFFECTNLEKMDLSMCKELQTIEDSAFESAAELTEVILPAKADETGLSLGKRVFAKTGITAIYESTNAKKTGILLPEYIEKVGDGCFYGNVEMKSVELPSGLPKIPDYLFDGCTALANITQRQDASGNCSVKEIGDCAFRSTAIENTDFLLKMNRLETIGYEKLQKLSTYKYPISKSNSQYIASLPVGGDSEDVAEFDPETHEKWYKNGQKYYGSEVFTNCTSLTRVNIPASVKAIGGRAFYFPSYDTTSASDLSKRSNIKTITWESSTEENAERYIHVEAFAGNMKVTSILLPENKNAEESLHIGTSAFYNDVALENIKSAIGEKNVLPATIKNIDQGAFYLCSGLKEITIQETEEGKCPKLGIKVFQFCNSLKEATLPKQITEIPRHFFYGAPLETFHVGDDSAIGITKIGALAFMGNQFVNLDLTKYTALKEIGSGAYAYADTVIEPEEPEKNSQLPIYPSSKAAYDTIGYLRPKLQSVILPAEMENDRVLLSTAVFGVQQNFDTMKIPGGKDGQIFIPDYFYNDNQPEVFAGTAVRKVVWEADTTGKNRWTTIPVRMFAACPNIEKAEDVLPKGDYVESLGKGLFADSRIVSADLSGYTSLKELGSGTLTGGNKENGVFYECTSLKSVKLPITSPDVELIVGKETFYHNVSLGDDGGIVDLGSAVSLGESAFRRCKGIIWVDNGSGIKVQENIGLKKIVFPDSLKEIGIRCFYECEMLEEVDFGKVETIGTDAFKACPELNLTKKGLSDNLVTIGVGAFQEDAKIGEVRFGSQLKTIGGNAFYNAGVTKIDFSKAENLEMIGTNVFSGTLVKNITIANTKVQTIQSRTFFGCRELEKVVFGEEVLYVDQDALAGCKELKELTIASTTTLNNRVFYSYYQKSGQDREYTANGDKISIVVNTPQKTVVPLGKSINLPYYISEAGNSEWDYILVGDITKNADVNASVKEHLLVSAKLKDGYYWGRRSVDDNSNYRITEPDYFNPLEETMSVRRTDNGREVDTLAVIGKKATEKPIDLSVIGSLSFDCAYDAKNEPVTIQASDVVATYNIVVDVVPLDVSVYSDFERENPLTVDGKENIQRLQVSSDTKAFPFYFDVMAELKNIDSDTYDVVIETDNPSVLYPAGSSDEPRQESYTTTDGTWVNNQTKEVTPNKLGQSFWLIAAGVGTAKIKIYPKGHPEYAMTYTYVVDSDVQSIRLAVPDEYNNGAVPGDEFNVFASYTNCLGQTVEAADLNNYAIYSNRSIVYSSEEAKYVSVDSMGNVMILKSDEKEKNVKITAISPTATEGQYVTGEVTIKVKNPYAQEDMESYTGEGTTETGTGSEEGKTETGTGTGKPDTTTGEETPGTGSDEGKPETGTGTGKPDVTTGEGTTGTGSDEGKPETGTGTGKPDTTTGEQKTESTVGGKITEVTDQDIVGSEPGQTKISNDKNIIDPKTGQFVAETGNNDNIVNPETGETIMKTDADRNTVDSDAVRTGVGTEADGIVRGPAAGEYVKDPITGATVVITIPGRGDSGGEVNYVIPANPTENTITVPDTVVVEGISYKVTSINPKAFKNNKKVKKIKLGKFVSQIADETFAGCISLTSITIPATVTRIGKKAFYNCKKLKTVTIRKGSLLTEIGGSAFQGCKVLTKITIPEKVIKIGAKTFYGCKKLKTITIKSTGLSAVGKNTFKNIDKKAKIKVPKKKRAAYKALLKGKGQKKTVKIK